ncbi:MAG: FtsX-like permease family protein [Balneolaceae bacterium]
MNQKSTNLLWLSSIRFLLRHPWHFALSIIGVALGVSVVVSIDISNNSAKRSFALSADAVTGKATHQIKGTAGSLDEEVYRMIRLDGKIRKSAPVVEGHGTIEEIYRTFQILGVDPLAEEAFRDFTSQQAGIELSEFLSDTPAALIAADIADQHGFTAGDTLLVSVGGREYRLKLAGVLEATDDRSRRALQNLLVMDIGTAQQILMKKGSLSRIDLIIPEDREGTIIPEIESLLPEGTSLVRSDSRNETVAQMTRAFELNLQALSMLALLVGMFLIYNTMTFSVVQRRALIGRLRALGITKREILNNVLKEALLIGVLGTVLGIVAGIFLAHGLVKLVTRSINDLYFVLSVQELSIGFFPLGKAALLGIGATLLAAFRPAREASEAEVSTVLRRSSGESKITEKLFQFAGYGLLTGIAGCGILLVPGGEIAAGYAALLFMVVGFVLVIPLLVTGMAYLLRPLMGRLNGIIGKMSVRGVVTQLSRTSVAIAALVVAVAATVGVGIMVDSFRGTVVSWLEAQLQADIYVQPPSSVTRLADAELEPELVSLLKNTEGVASSHTVLSVEIRTDNGMANLTATDLGPEAGNSYQLKEGSADFWEEYMNENIVMVSEAYAYHNDVSRGDSIFIYTDRGRAGFEVGAINFDYASDIGTITIHRDIYNRYFDDESISGLALYASAGTDVDRLSEQLREIAQNRQDVFIRSNIGLREASIAIFDRTFTVTVVLRLLAIIVAFIGILSALMALQLERTRELAVLRANGMTPGQLWNYVMNQTGVMGVMAGLLSIPLGILMAYILVYVINLRSFGWTLQFTISPEVLLQAVGLSVIAALLAGIYPSKKMAEANAADALRNG